MRATTRVSLAARHVGLKDSQVWCVNGSFAECIAALAAWIAPQSMATRFDLCIARSEEEARRGLTMKRGASTDIASEGLGLDLASLDKLMSGEGSVE